MSSPVDREYEGMWGGKCGHRMADLYAANLLSIRVGRDWRPGFNAPPIVNSAFGPCAPL